jgi:hypothetical protein
MIFKIIAYISNYFKRPSQLSIEVARVVFGFCSLLIFQHKQLIISGQNVHESWNVLNYFPKGILAFLGDIAPTSNTIDLWLFLQFWSAIFLIFGFLSSTALCINFITNLLLISLSESFTVGWSHGYNMNLLAQMPFIFAPVGRLFSIDAIIRKNIFKKEKSLSLNGIYLWMTNFGIVAIFFNAFFWKLFSTRQSLSFQWAFSENFRNQIVARYCFLGEEIPEYLHYLANHEWAWQTVAFLNLMFQALPFFSLFFFTKPKLRLLFGLLFVFEELGLMVVMQLYDYYWIPLILLFVDWDYFFKKKESNSASNDNLFRKPVQGVISLLYITYIAIYFVLSFHLQQIFFNSTKYVNSSIRHLNINAYPFSSYSMYSGLLAANEKGSYKELGFGFEVLDHASFSNAVSKRQFEQHIKRKFYGHANFVDSNETRTSCYYLLNYVNVEDTCRKINSIALKRNIYEYNPVSKPAGISLYEEAYIALVLNNKFHYLYPKHEIEDDTVYIKPIYSGFVPTEIKLKVYNYAHRKTYDWEGEKLAIPLNHPILEEKKVIFILQTNSLLNKAVNFSGNIAFL